MKLHSKILGIVLLLLIASIGLLLLRGHLLQIQATKEYTQTLPVFANENELLRNFNFHQEKKIINDGYRHFCISKDLYTSDCRNNSLVYPYKNVIDGITLGKKCTESEYIINPFDEMTIKRDPYWNIVWVGYRACNEEFIEYYGPFRILNQNTIASDYEKTDCLSSDNYFIQLHWDEALKNPIHTCALHIDRYDIEHSPQSIEENISKFSNLKYLHLRFFPFKNYPEQIGQLTNLELLDLSFNDNGEIASIPASFKYLKNLKTLDISRNRVSNKTLEEIRSMLPQVHIIY